MVPQPLNEKQYGFWKVRKILGSAQNKLFDAADDEVIYTWERIMAPTLSGRRPFA